MIIGLATGRRKNVFGKTLTHFTPTYSSWLNQVERWFTLITNQAIRRGSFDSVADLKRKIDTFVKHYNQHPQPFRWTATAGSSLLHDSAVTSPLIPSSLLPTRSEMHSFFLV